jgi:hypothetical protein
MSPQMPSANVTSHRMSPLRCHPHDCVNKIMWSRSSKVYFCGANNIQMRFSPPRNFHKLGQPSIHFRYFCDCLCNSFPHTLCLTFCIGQVQPIFTVHTSFHIINYEDYIFSKLKFTQLSIFINCYVLRAKNIACATLGGLFGWVGKMQKIITCSSYVIYIFSVQKVIEMKLSNKWSCRLAYKYCKEETKRRKRIMQNYRPFNCWGLDGQVGMAMFKKLSGSIPPKTLQLSTGRDFNKSFD